MSNVTGLDFEAIKDMERKTAHQISQLEALHCNKVFFTRHLSDIWFGVAAFNFIARWSSTEARQLRALINSLRSMQTELQHNLNQQIHASEASREQIRRLSEPTRTDNIFDTLTRKFSNNIKNIGANISSGAKEVFDQVSNAVSGGARFARSIQSQFMNHVTDPFGAEEIKSNIDQHGLFSKQTRDSIIAGGARTAIFGAGIAIASLATKALWKPTPVHAPAQTTPTAQAKPSSYTVKSGDTLGQIAAKHNTTVSAIANANNIADPNLIHPGQELTLPTDAAAAASVAAAPAAPTPPQPAPAPESDPTHSSVPGTVGAEVGKLPGSDRGGTEAIINGYGRAHSIDLGGHQAGGNLDYWCTSWQKYRWHELGATGLNQAFGHGHEVAHKITGYKPDEIPTLGAAVSTKLPGQQGRAYGHVMVVEEIYDVSPDNGTMKIRVSELNALGGRKDTDFPDTRKPQERANTFYNQRVFERHANGSWFEITSPSGAPRGGTGIRRNLSFANFRKHVPKI